MQKERAKVSASVVIGHVAMALQTALFAMWQPSGTIAIICALATLKTIVYGALLRRLVVAVISSVDRFHDFLWKMVGLMFVAMASFAGDFYVVYQVDPNSLAALSPQTPWIEQLFNCWYFSVLNFSFFGVADIIPQTMGSRFLLSLEALASFLTLVLILSDFGALRESIRKASADAYTNPTAK